MPPPPQGSSSLEEALSGRSSGHSSHSWPPPCPGWKGRAVGRPRREGSLTLRIPRLPSALEATPNSVMVSGHTSPGGFWVLRWGRTSHLGSSPQEWRGQGSGPRDKPWAARPPRAFACTYGGASPRRGQAGAHRKGNSRVLPDPSGCLWDLPQVHKPGWWLAIAQWERADSRDTARDGDGGACLSQPTGRIPQSLSKHCSPGSSLGGGEERSRPRWAERRAGRAWPGRGEGSQSGPPRGLKD